MKNTKGKSIKAWAAVSHDGKLILRFHGHYDIFNTRKNFGFYWNKNNRVRVKISIIKPKKR